MIFRENYYYYQDFEAFIKGFDQEIAVYTSDNPNENILIQEALNPGFLADLFKEKKITITSIKVKDLEVPDMDFEEWIESGCERTEVILNITLTPFPTYSDKKSPLQA